MTQTSNPPSAVKTHRIGPIYLAPGILPLHGWTFFYGGFVSIGLLVFITIGQTYILNEHLNIPLDQQGTLTGDLVFWTEVVALLLVTPVAARIIGTEMGKTALFAIGMSTLAMAWNAAYNWLFDMSLIRCGRPLQPRGFRLRAVHAVLFEAGLFAQKPVHPQDRGPAFQLHAGTPPAVPRITGQNVVGVLTIFSEPLIETRLGGVPARIQRVEFTPCTGGRESPVQRVHIQLPEFVAADPAHLCPRLPFDSRDVQPGSG